MRLWQLDGLSRLEELYLWSEQNSEVLLQWQVVTLLRF